MCSTLCMDFFDHWLFNEVGVTRKKSAHGDRAMYGKHFVCRRRPRLFGEEVIGRD